MANMNKNSSLQYLLIALVLSMLCLSFASVPLYRIFCKVTGYGGTTKQSTAPINKSLGKHEIKVRFSATTNNIPILFSPEQSYVTVRPGTQKLIFYRAQNTTEKPITGMAVYNVSPVQAGKYFNKIACFCFTQQTFEPHTSIVMPVSFFIDPEIENDVSTAHIREITLSYIFFDSSEAESAIKNS
ncbi:cytochrome c oxidase assembly protein [Anaplasma phagocytophilum]|uniref:Cytochrome c oxidase assembly protein CtaG n=4 Tax=Anaplasma phagocytophilum TaxID=948 RepID=A0A0F3NES1_ANAPH|nr:cytochrome c oxidase assembly CtaG/Cox11 family protein [Anaplasma phagocytophilum str. ApNP]